MKKMNGAKLSSGELFNTSALSRTNNIGQPIGLQPILILGKGSDQKDRDALKRRAKKKAIDRILMI